MNNSAGNRDRVVGTIAGAICGDITTRFALPPLMLVPAITFKVKKRLEQIDDLSSLSDDQKLQLAKDIKTSIVPMLFSYDIDSNMIEQIMPVIESAAKKALLQMEE